MDKDLTRLQLCIDHVFEANRLEHGERILHCIQIPIYDIAHRCVQRIRERYDLDTENLQMNGYDERTQLCVDAVALETILLNLLDNAVKYSPDTKSIMLTFTADKQQSCIAVSDKGLGIESKDIKQLFKRFIRLHTNISIPGTGLGLVLVENLAQRMDMQVIVHSNGSGCGSTFTVVAPHQQGDENMSHK